MLAALLLIVAAGLPTLLAWAMTPDGMHFTGLLFNPQDANSYIAKMRQGLAGSWSFRLPYTSVPHDGAPIYLFYLSLGHMARWSGLSPIVLYHAARVAGGLALLLPLYALVCVLSDDAGERRAMFLLAALGSGLGWLVVLLGYQTADLWVPEAFPFYALLANAHFPLAMGLMVCVVLCGAHVLDGTGRTWCWGTGLIAAAVALGVIQPFGLPAALGGLGVLLLDRAVRCRQVAWRSVGWTLAGGAAALPYPLYMGWAIRSDPVLALWDAQNVTVSPPLWDWVLSYGLVAVLAALGAVSAMRRASGKTWLLLGWVGVTAVGLALPLPLQRRLSLGLGVPLGLLAGMGWWRVVRPRVRPRQRGLVQGLVVAFCALTPVFLALAALLAARAGEPWFYLSDGEWQALAWLRDEGRPGAVVLCAPQTGLFVPAWAGQPVVYGHPFETVEAERWKGQVEAYWAGEMSAEEQEAFLRAAGVGYLFVGPRELAGGGWEAGTAHLVFEAEDVRVYETR